MAADDAIQLELPAKAGLELRAPLAAFAQEMERKLRLHDEAKGARGWQGGHQGQLLDHLGRELRELRRAVDRGPWEDVLAEAADVANMAMMVADAQARLEVQAKLLALSSGPGAAPAAGEIVATCEEICNLLLKKNTRYGNSALEPARIFSRSDALEQIRVRIDDKLTRLQRGRGDDEDTELDLLGYLVLLRVARKRAGRG